MNLDRIIAVRNHKTIYRDGERCLKIFDEDFSKSDVLNEALNQARIEETGLNIPKIIEVTTVDGRWAIVSEYIKGKTLARLISESKESKDDYLNRLIDLQLDMHTHTCPLLNKLTDKMSIKIRKTDLSATHRYDLDTRLKSMSKGNVVCHGDFNLSNIIISENDTPYIIDWSHATQGNPTADIARTYLLFWLNGDISGGKRYLKMVCEKSQTPIDFVQRWMPIVAADRLGAGIEKEREFLLSWINVVEYE